MLLLQVDKIKYFIRIGRIRLVVVTLQLEVCKHPCFCTKNVKGTCITHKLYTELYSRGPQGLFLT